MGRLIRYFHNKIQSIKFYLKTGLRESAVRRVCKELSNRYLTPGQPGWVGKEIKIVTTGKDMLFEVEGKAYWVNRTNLEVKLGDYGFVPMWDVPVVSGLFSYFIENGIIIPHNTAGVTYYAMPGEELHGNA